MEDKVKQLIAKLGEDFGEIYPLNYINNILDKWKVVCQLYR